ncbi:MAG: serine/threonine protein kinase [Spirulina sp.]
MSSSLVNERYQIHKRLSLKGARQTFLALDIKTQKPVVLKVLLFGRDSQWQDHKLFERGANALQSLSHPRIPCYLDYFDLETDKAKGFVQVQSYIPARSLQQHLDAGRTFSELEMRQLARDLLEILIYLHSRQPAVIHRDIKPSNILLSDRSGNRVGEVYLVDFDSVKTCVSAQPGSTMTIVGTYGYMPPEQFGGKAYPASDLYGLGATLIAIATRKQPSDLPQKNLRIDFEGETNLSLDFTNWLKWLVEPDLDRRLSSAREALQALENPHVSPERLRNALPRKGKPNDSRIILRQEQSTQRVHLNFLEKLEQELQTYKTLRIPFPELSIDQFHKLEIHPVRILHVIIPHPRFSQHNLWSKIAYVILFLVGLPIFSYSLWFLLTALSSEGFLPSLFGLVVSLVLLFLSGMGLMMIFPLLKCLFWETHLKIYPINIVMYNTMMVKINWKKSLRRNLLAIQTETTSNRNRVLLVTEDRILKMPKMSEKETIWLAEELSQWLKLPIQQLARKKRFSLLKN